MDGKRHCIRQLSGKVLQQIIKRYGAMDCIECGSCAYICPAKRRLMESIRLAKKKIKEGNL